MVHILRIQLSERVVCLFFCFTMVSNVEKVLGRWAQVKYDRDFKKFLQEIYVDL